MITTSFFSYKGGSCRSTTTMNTAYFLAKQTEGPTEEEATAEKPIVLVDMDVDSAGLTILFETHNIKDKLTVQGLIGTPENELNALFRSNYKGELSGHPFFSQLIPVGKFLGLKDNRAALLLPADISNNGKFTVSEKEAQIFTTMKSVCRQCGCKALIFDTPAGAQVNANISLSNSDIIVCCMRPTYQFRAGTTRFLCESFENGKEFNYILCPTAVSKQEVILPGGTVMPDKLAELFVSDVINPISNVKVGNETGLEHIDERMIRGNDNGILGIPEVALFKWKEACLSNLDELSDDEKEALECYKYLAHLIKEDA